MKKYLQILLFGLLMVSCGTPKDIAYFQDRQPGTSAPAIIRNSTPFKVRPGDRVSIYVKSRNEKLSQQFNMYSGNMSGMGLGNGQSGYLVDEKGEICDIQLNYSESYAHQMLRRTLSQIYYAIANL